MSYSVNLELCIQCDECDGTCPVDALHFESWKWCYSIDQKKCVECGNCLCHCPTGAIGNWGKTDEQC